MLSKISKGQAWIHPHACINIHNDYLQLNLDFGFVTTQFDKKKLCTLKTIFKMRSDCTSTLFWCRFLTPIFENAQLFYHFLFVSLWDLSFCSYQMKRIIRVNIFLDSPSTFLPLQAKRTEYCVSGTPTTPDQQYQILST